MSRPRLLAAVVAGAVAVGLVLSGCASNASSGGGGSASGSTAASSPATGTSAAGGSSGASSAPSASSGSGAASSASSAASGSSGSSASSAASGSAGSSASSSAAASVSVPSAADLAALVPAKIKSAGKLVVGVNVPYSPNEFIQNGQVVGFDVDLMNATAKVLGLGTEYQQADFTKIIPAVQAGTMDIGMSSFTDTKDREKQVDFVNYFSAGFLWAQPAGKTVDPNNACGLTVSVQSGTTEQQDELPALSKACVSAGKKPITIQQFQSQDAATNALVLGQVDAMSADSPVTAYAIKQAGGKIEQAGQIMESAPYGWPIAKGSTLVKAMQGALQTLMNNGQYLQICQKWGVQSGAITTATINGAVS